jgi:hypothetical protein
MRQAKQTHLDVMHMVLGHQLVDANYVECGKVEDVELTGGTDELKVTAIITGPGAAVERLPKFLRPLARKLFGSRETCVPWEEVQVITSRVKLNSRADELGLADEDKRVAEWLKQLPGAE